MLCAYCHSELSEGAESCAHCGAEVRMSATSGSPVGAAADLGKSLNPGLYKLHTFFSYLYLLIAVAVLLVAIAASRGQVFVGVFIGLLAGLIFLGLAALHRYAAKGARFGKDYGRATSFAIACLWLLGFPIGTILAIYVFTKIFKSWEGSGEPETAAAAGSVG